MPGFIFLFSGSSVSSAKFLKLVNHFKNNILEISQIMFELTWDYGIGNVEHEEFRIGIESEESLQNT